ncbi:23S rRNA (adenine(1618)-N(6))-methyltransferase RlmF [Vibrio sp.]|nr:23S rRNA (adenine(1618)-N(6))-methyltransferase RlmF [Vibrio sp.]
MKFQKINAIKGLCKENPLEERYQFKQLTQSMPELKSHIINNPRGEMSIDFSNPLSVKLLNKALLKYYFNIKDWDIPKGYLCPPIPSRSDYIYRLLLLLGMTKGKGNKESINKAENNTRSSMISMLDIGTGANLVYPIVACSGLGWRVVGADIDPISVKNAKKIVSENGDTMNNTDIRLQKDPKCLFIGVIKNDEYFDVTVCNPPFHKSAEEAAEGNQRKRSNLSKNQDKRRSDLMKEADKPSRRNNRSKLELNFGGQNTELWAPGGELGFIKRMMFESRHYRNQVGWFTTLISKKENVRPMKKWAQEMGAKEVKVIEMMHGQKITRIFSWTYTQ